MSGSPLPLIASSVLLFLFQGSSAFVPISFGARGRSNVQLHSKISDDDDTDSTRPRICVLGGGFGGVNTALTLEGLPWPADLKPKITLVDQKERFVFLPLLYELCVDDASVEEVAPTYNSLLRDSSIDFVQREIAGVDAKQNLVHTNTIPSNGSLERGTIEYDALVVATGAELNLGSIPGAEEFALPFYTVDQCYELRRRFNILESVSASRGEPLEVVIIGGGYSGVELALNTLQRLGGNNKQVRVTLIHRGGEVLQYATDYNRKTGQDRLKAAGIKVMTETNVVEILSEDEDETSGDLPANTHRCRVKTSHNEKESLVKADLLLWTAGATASNNKHGVLNSILPRDESGRIVTGKLMRAKGFEDVYALGDCSRARQVPYAATAQVAIQQAPLTAWNIFADIMNKNGRKDVSGEEYKLLSFQYLDLGEMMTLGSDDATISSLGGLVQLSGPGASILRRLIYAVRMPTAQQGVAAVLESTERRLVSPAYNGKKREKRSGKVIAWK